MIEDKYNNNNLDSTNFTGLNVNENIIIKEIKEKDTNVIKEITEKGQRKKDNRGDIEPIVKEHINIEAEINTIDDILLIIDTYKLDRSIKYNINLRALHNIKEPLQELNNMIGMKDLKANIVDQIIYFTQDLHKGGDGDFTHTVIMDHPALEKPKLRK